MCRAQIHCPRSPGSTPSFHLAGIAQQAEPLCLPQRKRLTRFHCSQGLQQALNADRPFWAQREGLTHSARASELHPPSDWNLMNFTFTWYKSHFGDYDRFVNTSALKKKKVYEAKIHQEHSNVFFDKIIFTLGSTLRLHYLI